VIDNFIYTYKNQIWHEGSRRRRNHLFPILAKSVKGFLSCEWSKMRVFHWLWQSPLQQVSTTVLPVIVMFSSLLSSQQRTGSMAPEVVTTAHCACHLRFDSLYSRISL